MSGFEDLTIYKKAIKGTVQVYKLSIIPPLNKDYSLQNQIKRASASVAANIAEGYGRQSNKDFSRYLTIAIGSINEVVAFLDIISHLYPNIDISKIRKFYKTLGKQTWAFRQSILNK